MKLEVVPEMTATCARDLTDRIKTAANDLEEMLWSAHKGKAWKSLGYASWQAYCATEFQFSKQHSYRLLNSAKVKNTLRESHQLVTPQSEGQVRVLATLEPEQQSAAWKQAVEIANGKQPTAKQGCRIGRQRH
jgi:hypothetical protein